MREKTAMWTNLGVWLWSLPIHRFSTQNMDLEEVTEDYIPVGNQDSVITNPLATESESDNLQKLLDSEEVASLSQLDDGETGPKDDEIVEQSPRKLRSASPLPPILEPSIFEEDSVFADFTGLDEDDSYSDTTDDINITPRSRFQPTCQPVTSEPEKENRIQQQLQHCSKPFTSTSCPITSHQPAFEA